MGAENLPFTSLYFPKANLPWLQAGKHCATHAQSVQEGKNAKKKMHYP
jgi:hypothetical protein